MTLDFFALTDPESPTPSICPPLTTVPGVGFLTSNPCNRWCPGIRPWASYWFTVISYVETSCFPRMVSSSQGFLTLALGNSPQAQCLDSKPSSADSRLATPGPWALTLAGFSPLQNFLVFISWISEHPLLLHRAPAMCEVGRLLWFCFWFWANSLRSWKPGVLKF